jgi:hypothetical protein
MSLTLSTLGLILAAFLTFAIPRAFANGPSVPISGEQTLDPCVAATSGMAFEAIRAQKPECLDKLWHGMMTYRTIGVRLDNMRATYPDLKVEWVQVFTHPECRFATTPGNFCLRLTGPDGKTAMKQIGASTPAELSGSQVAELARRARGCAAGDATCGACDASIDAALRARASEPEKLKIAGWEATPSKSCAELKAFKTELERRAQLAACQTITPDLRALAKKPEEEDQIMLWQRDPARHCDDFKALQRTLEARKLSGQCDALREGRTADASRDLKLQCLKLSDEQLRAKAKDELGMDPDTCKEQLKTAAFRRERDKLAERTRVCDQITRAQAINPADEVPLFEDACASATIDHDKAVAERAGKKAIYAAKRNMKAQCDALVKARQKAERAHPGVISGEQLGRVLNNPAFGLSPQDRELIGKQLVDPVQRERLLRACDKPAEAPCKAALEDAKNRGRVEAALTAHFTPKSPQEGAILRNYLAKAAPDKREKFLAACTDAATCRAAADELTREVARAYKPKPRNRPLDETGTVPAVAAETAAKPATARRGPTGFAPLDWLIDKIRGLFNWS